MPIRLSIALLLFLVGNLAAQRGKLDEQILRGEFAAAKTTLAACSHSLSETDRALYEAAVLPAPQRAGAMLNIVRLYPQHAVADRALLAAAAAVILGTDRCRLVEDLEALEAREPDAAEQWATAVDLGPRMVALGELLRQREPLDHRSFDEATRLWQLARTRLHHDPIRIRTGRPIPVPAPLAEPVAIRFYAWPSARSLEAFAAGDARQPLRVRDVAAGEYGVQFAALPAGEYLVEVESRANGLRTVRKLLVSDLDVVVQRVEDAVVVFVELADRPVAGASVRVGTQDTATDARGIATLSVSHDRHAVARVRSGEHSATATIPRVDTGRPAASPTCHVAVDRPLYRRGETVRGRVVLRTPGLVTVDGLAGTTGTGALPAPLAATVVTLHAWRGAARPVRITAKTDNHGVLPFEFRIPETAPFGFATLEVTRTAGAKRETLGRYLLFEVAAYKRAVITARLDGPEHVDPKTAKIVLTLTARYASGAPARGLRVGIDAWLDGDHAKEVAYLDDGGRLSIPVAVERLAYRGSLSAEVFAPDGTVVSCEHEFWRRRAPAQRTGPWVEAVGAVRAGAPLRVRVHGTKNTRALVTLARGTPLAARVVGLGDAGTGTVTFDLPAAAWPSVDVLVSTRHGTTDERFETEPARGLHRVAVTADKTAYRPGEEVQLTIRNRDLEGVACAANVMVAVVDERMFALAPDRTPDLRAALAPRVPPLWGRRATRWAMPPRDPLRVIGMLLRLGRLHDAGVSTPGPGAPGAGSAGLPPRGPRSDFAPTAFFAANVRAGADGTATIRFRLPDSLTKYRTTVLAVDDGAGTATTVAHLEVGKHLAITALVPRAMRLGDRVELPVVVDNRGEPSTGSVRIADDAGILQVAGADASPALRTGANESAFAVTAREEGTARLRSSVRADGAADASLRPVPILGDAIEQPVVETLRFRGETVWRPEAATPGARRRVVLLGSRSAVVAACERFLAEYPHGCVEQTLSRILPYFAVARAGGTPRSLSGAERRRLFAGVRRLRALQAGDARFAWWPGGVPDDGMSALVVHGLVMAREGGLDLAAHGLRLDFRRGHVAAAAAALVRARGVVKDIEAAELVVAALRFAPAGDFLRATRAVLRARQDLPPGFLARTGLALVAAGDTEGAALVLQRLREGKGIAGAVTAGAVTAWDRFPGEEPAAVAAARLELLLATNAPRAERDAAGLAVYATYGGGSFGSTLGTSWAIAALLKDAGNRPRVGGPQRVVVTVDGRAPRTVQLAAANGYREAFAVPDGEIRLSTDEDREVLALVESTAVRPGSTNAGWQSGLTVERELDGALARGMPVTVRLAVTGRMPARYVVVSCPIPAGFEVVDRAGRFDVFDDRVVTTIHRLVANRPARVRFRMVPSLAGEMAWPPATAAAMYVTGCTGGSRGARLTVKGHPARSPAVPLGVLFARAAVSPEPVRTEPDGFTDRVDDWIRRVREASVHDGVRHAAVATLTSAQARLLAELDDLPEDPDVRLAVLGRLDWGLDDLPAAGAANGPVLEAARARVRAIRGRAAEDLGEAAERALQSGDRDRVADCFAILADLAGVGDRGDRGDRGDLGDRGVALVRALCLRLVKTADAGLLEELLYRHDGMFSRRELRPFVITLLQHREPGVRSAALSTLPAAGFAGVPTRVLERAIGEDWDEYAAHFLAHPLGGPRLLELLGDAAFAREHAKAIADVLPPALRKRAPLAFFRYAAYDVDLAESGRPDAELLGELERTRDPAWQTTLLRTLAGRGVRRSDDPFFDAWLRARGRDRDAAMMLRRRIWADAEGVRPLPLEPDFVASAFRWDWTATEFLELADSSDEQRRVRFVRARCSADPTWAVRVLDQAERTGWFVLADLPVELPATVREALVRLAQRDVAWLGEVVATFERRPADVEWLRKCASELPEGEVRDTFATATCEPRRSAPPRSAELSRLVGVPRR